MQQASMVLWTLVLGLSAAQMTCQTYQCRPSGVQMANNTCAVTDQGNVYIQPCSSESPNSYCNVATGKCTSPPTTTLQSYPGEPCAKQSDCAVGTCTQGTCVGLSLGTRCSNSNQCAPGLFCSSGLCSLQRAIGSSCSTDYDCVSSAGCVNSNCTAYYSLPVNSTVPDCSPTGTSNFCAKIACQRSGWIGTTGKCIAVPKNLQPNPTKCTSNLNCTSTDGVHNYTGTCTCGYNSAGDGYCQPVLGDSQGLWLVQAYKSAVARSNGLCNTARRMAQACWQVIGEWDNVKTQYWGFYYLPLIQGNDRCVEQTFTRTYWSDSAGRVTLAWIAIAAYFS